MLYVPGLKKAHPCPCFIVNQALQKIFYSTIFRLFIVLSQTSISYQNFILKTDLEALNPAVNNDQVQKRSKVKRLRK